VDCKKDEGGAIFGSGCPYPAAAKNGGEREDKKISYIHKDIGNHKAWLPNPEPTQTIDIILPNTIHGCNKKNLS